MVSIRDEAEKSRRYLKDLGFGLEIQNRLARIKLWAERQAGSILSQLKLRGGDRRSSSCDERLTLADLGISSSQSSRWQRVASIPADAFEWYVELATAMRREITSAGLLRFSRQLDELSEEIFAGDQRRDGNGFPLASRR